ncbi:MAG: hypothetical protein JJV88_04430 [Sulfurovum sp.]|nr:hypothetical protein [Sulfurovaceae bacterium]
MGCYLFYAKSKFLRCQDKIKHLKKLGFRVNPKDFEIDKWSFRVDINDYQKLIISKETYDIDLIIADKNKYADLKKIKTADDVKKSQHSEECLFCGNGFKNEVKLYICENSTILDYL